MTAAELHEIGHHGIATGAHSRTHRALEGLPAADLINEVDGSLADLEELGLNSDRLFCYPFGAVDAAAEERLRNAGAGAAFTVSAGIVTSNSNPLRLPRIEILRKDGAGLRFLWKVYSGGRPGPRPAALLRRLIRPLQPRNSPTVTSG